MDGGIGEETGEFGSSLGFGWCLLIRCVVVVVVVAVVAIVALSTRHHLFILSHRSAAHKE